MSLVIWPGFAKVAERYTKLYEKDYIRRAVTNLVKLVEEKGIKCSLQRYEAAGEAEVIGVRCIDTTVFPTSEFTIPIVWEQELDEACNTKVVQKAQMFLETETLEELADVVLTWISVQNCKVQKLWEIITSLGLAKIITFDQVQKLFIPDLLSYPFT